MSLKLVKRPRGASWYIRGTYLGVCVFRSTGTDRKAAAWQELRAVERRIEQGGGVTRHTFADAALAYLKVCPDSEVPKVERLLSFFGVAALADIDPAAIQHCADALYPTAAPGTVNRNCLTPLAAVLHHGAGLGMCQWLRVRKRREPRGRDMVLTPEQGQDLLDACPPKLHAIVLFMLTTGCRAGEAIKLTWADVDLNRAHVTFSDTKNGETYGCHLHSLTVAELASLPRLNDSVFGYSYVNRRALNRDFKAACARAGIPCGRPHGITPHSLRHTYATWLRQGGEDLRSVMALGRWKDVKSVARYAHVSAAEQRAAIESLPVQNPRNRRQGTGK